MGTETIIVSGAIGRCCGLGGNAWFYMQYLIGLRRLGYDVYFLEDCGEGSWVYNWDTEQVTSELDFPATYLRDCLEPFGFENRWIYRTDKESVGINIEHFQTVCSQAELLIICADPMSVWRSEYDLPKQRVFIDVDPGFTQISLANNDNAALSKTVEKCERVFTIGQNIGNTECPIPLDDRDWFKILPFVSLPDWSYSRSEPAEKFTCVMSWRGFHDVVYNGIPYGQKDKSFPEFLQLPSHTSQPILLAHRGADPELLAKHGWEVESGHISSFTPDNYREYIQQSRAEFSVAKHMYVEAHVGWISDRSVCYLAAGRPILVHDTIQGDWLPTGEGVVTFTNMEEALAGIDAINSDYENHRLAARKVAEEYFSGEKTLTSFLEVALN